MKHTLPFLIAATVFSSAIAEAQAAYRPGTYRYTRAQTMTTTIEMGGQQNTTTVSTDEHLSLALTAKGRDTLTYSLTIDSAKVNGEDGMAGAGRQIASARAGTGQAGAGRTGGGQTGAGRAGGGGDRAARRGGRGGMLGATGDGGALEGQSFRGSIAPNGRFLDEGTAPAVARAMRQFLIEIPSALRAGMRWTDTLPPLVLPMGGPNVEGSQIAETEVVGDTTYAGLRAWKLRRTVSLQLQGTAPMGRAGGVGAEFYAEGAGEGIFYISTTGIFLGGAEGTDISATASLGPNVQIPMYFRIENSIGYVRGG